MPTLEAYAEPLSVEVCEGEVVLRAVNGPFSVSLTAAAAAKTAKGLAKAAKAALSHHASQEDAGRD